MATMRRNNKSQKGMLKHGFNKQTPGIKSNKDSFSISKKAMTGKFVKSPVLLLKYRSLTPRMAQLNQQLRIYLADHLVATVPLNSTNELSIYFDVTELMDSWVSIRVETDNAFVPKDERWFNDSASYGAVIT